MNTTASMTWEEAVLWLKRQPDSADLVRACFYDDPLSDVAERYWQCSEWQSVRKLLPTFSCRALDIGSGRGIAAYALARDGHVVTALEPDPSDIVGAGAIRKLAQVSGQAIDVVETWGETLPFASASFDVVHCRQVLHHARDLGELCSQIARVLKPGGLFIATREHVISRREDLPSFLDSHPLHRHYGGEHAYLLSEYTEAIERGLKICAILNPLETPINFYPATREELKVRLAGKLRFPFPRLIPNAALTLAGRWITTPGRLFSFIARKPVHA